MGEHMQTRLFAKWSIRLLTAVLLIAGPAWAQFSSSVQGTVTDPTGAVVVGAKVTLVNTVTHVSASTASSATGLYRFLSLAPGSYTITVPSPSFGTTADTITLLTDQSLNFDVALKVGSSSQTVTVTAETPVLNTGEIRNQQTIETSGTV